MMLISVGDAMRGIGEMMIEELKGDGSFMKHCPLTNDVCIEDDCKLFIRDTGFCSFESVAENLADIRDILYKMMNEKR